MQHFRKVLSLLLSFLFLLLLFPISSALAAGDVTVEYAPPVFNQVRAITLDASDGGFYVCDGSFDRVKKYTSTGVLDTTFVSDGIFGFEPPNELSDVRDICFDSSGNFYIADCNSDRVVKYSSVGVQDTSFDNDDGDADTSDDDGVVDGFGNVYSVAIGWHSGTEYVYVCDQMDNYITRYDITNGNKDAGFQIYVPDNHFPSAIGIDQNNNIYVSVCYTTEGNTTQEIRKFDSTGAQDNTFNTASGQVDEPAGLYIDSSDRVYVADRANDRILRLKTDGSLDTSFASGGILGGVEGSAPDQFKSPRDVVVDETNGFLYVADSANYRVKKYILTKDGGTTTCTLDTGFDGDGVLGDCRGSDTDDQLLQAEDVAACPDGGYIVADSNNDRIKKYTAAGVLDTSFHGDGILGHKKELGGTEFDAVGEVAVHPVNGNIYVVDRYRDAIKIYDTTGAYQSTITNATYMTNPRGLTVDNAGNVYVGDTTGNWVVKFDSSGNVAKDSSNNDWCIDVVDDPYSIALDTDGASIFVAVYGSTTDHVKKFDSDGDLDTSFSGDGILTDGFDGPRGVTVDSEGNLYVSDSILDLIKKYDSSGTPDTSFDGDGTYSRSRYESDDFLDSPYGMAVVGSKLYVADRTNCRIVVLSNIGLVSSEKKITSFVFESFNPDVNGTIDEGAHTVTLTVPHDTDVSSLTPTIAVSAKASVSPASGAAQNFTSSVDYTVTAEDASQQVYAVTVNIAPDNDATLSDLTFGGSTVTGFAPGNTSYNVTAAHDTTTVTIGAATTDPNASASGTGSFAFSGNSQIYTVTVTAEDTTTQETYDINVTRLPDDNATLSDLSFNGSTVTGFDAGDTDYNVSVDHGATTVTIGATTADPNASVSGTGSFAFSGNSQVYTVTVTAEDTTTQETYNINVTRLPDDDATLSDLTFNGATVSGFNSNITSYNATADHHATTVTIGAVTNDPNASASGTGTLAFTGDSQVYTITVTAQDGTTQKTYRINVVRTPDNDATLSDLTFGGTTVSGFDAGTTSYNVTVGHHASTVTIGATPTDPNASASGTGTLVFSGNSQTYTVTVTAEDATTQETYDINVTRAPDNDATLSDLSVDGTTVTGFVSSDTDYTVFVDPSTTSVTIGATTADSNASVSGTGTFSFNGEAQTYTVTVTAEDGSTQKTYDVNVNRTLRDDATLSDLTFDGDTVAGFASNDTSYDITVVHEVTSVTIGATTSDVNASAVGTGTFAFSENSKTFTVKVTAEDGTTTKTYDINVTRTPDDDATLSDLTVDGITLMNFDAADTEYDVSAAHDATAVTIGATTNDPNASASGTGILPFSGNAQAYTVTVTAEDGSTSMSYTVNIIREDAPDPDSIVSITGTLLDDYGNPLVGYTVELHSVPRSTVTDAQGKYTFADVEMDDHTLIVKDTSGDTVNTIGISIQSGEEFAWDQQEADIDVTVEDNTAMIDVTIALDGEGNIAVDDVEERENPETGSSGGSWLILTIVLAAILASMLVLLIRRIRDVKTEA